MRGERGVRSIGLKEADAQPWMFAKVPSPRWRRTGLIPTSRRTVRRRSSGSGLGASLVADHEEYGVRWTVLQDVEGNEFCVAGKHGGRPQAREGHHCGRAAGLGVTSGIRLRLLGCCLTCVRAVDDAQGRPRFCPQAVDGRLCRSFGRNGKGIHIRSHSAPACCPQEAPVCRPGVHMLSTGSFAYSADRVVSGSCGLYGGACFAERTRRERPLSSTMTAQRPRRAARWVVSGAWCSGGQG